MGNMKIHKLREKLMEELENHAKEGQLDTAKMEAIYKLTESIKAIDTICAMEDHEEGNNSYNSYAYRGRHRDSMGRYSYDEAKSNVAHKLNDMMMCTENEHTKAVLRNAISQLEMN